jgi:hypothetical protein
MSLEKAAFASTSCGRCHIQRYDKTDTCTSEKEVAYVHLLIYILGCESETPCKRVKLAALKPIMVSLGCCKSEHQNLYGANIKPRLLTQGK